MPSATVSRAPTTRGACAEVLEGAAAPLGATVVDGGVNFSVFSKHATAIELLLFDAVDDGRAARVVPLDPATHRDYHYWHAWVPGVTPGQIYGYRVHGPSDPARGQRFDSGKLLLDPHGRGVVVPKAYNRAAAGGRGDNTAVAMKAWSSIRPRTIGMATGVCAAPRLGPSSTRCTSAASPCTPAPACRRRDAARMRGSSTRFPTCRSSASPRSSCCRSSSSTPSTARPATSTTGATRRCRSSLLTRPTARARIRSGRSTSSATW